MPMNGKSIVGLLAAAGVGIAGGVGLDHALTGRTGAATGSGAALPQNADEARRAIAELLREPASTESTARLAQLLSQLGPESVGAVGPLLLDPSETLDI